MPEGKPPLGMKERRSRRSRIRRRLVRIPHPHLPHLTLTQVRLLRLFSLLLLFSVLVLYGVFRSERFQERLRRKSELVLGRNLGRPDKIGRFDLSLLPPAFLLRDVSVANDPRGLSGPCFSAVEIALKGIPRITSERIDLPKISLLSPRVVFEIFEDGSSNFSSILAALPKSKGGGTDLRVKEAVLQRGTFRFREWNARLDVLLKDAALTARAGPFSRVTTAALACRRAQFKLEDNEILSFELGAEIVLSPGRLHLHSLRLHGEDLAAWASGGIDNLKTPVIALSATASTTGQALRRVFGLGLPLEGPITASGTIRIPPGGSYRIRGLFEVAQASFGPFPLSGSGFIRVDPSGLVASMAPASSLGGSVETFVRLQRIKNPPLPVRILVKARNLDFEEFLGDLDLKGTGLMARADLDTTLTFGRGGVEHADGAGAFRLTGSANQPSAVKGRHALPMSGGGPLLVRDGKIRFAGTVLTTAGGARVGLDGTLAFGTWVPSFQIQLDTRDLAEVERIADNFYPAILHEPLSPPLELGGSGSLEGRFERSFANPRVSGHLSASRFVLRGVPFGEAAADFVVDQNVLDLAPFTASDAGGQLSLTGRLGWGGRLADHYRLDELTGDFARWPIERILKFLSIDLPLEGRVTGRLPLSGVTPALTGSVALEWEPARIFGQELDRAEGVLSFEGDKLRVSGFRGILGSGQASGSGFYRYKDRGFELSLDAAGVSLGRMAAVSEQLPGLLGVLTGSVAGEGTVDRPSLSVRGTIDKAAWQDQALGPGPPVAIEATAREGKWEAVIRGPGEALFQVHTEEAALPGGATRVELSVGSLEPYGSLLGFSPEEGFGGHLSATARYGADSSSLEGALTEGEITLSGKTVHLRKEAAFRWAAGRLSWPGLVLQAVGRAQEGASKGAVGAGQGVAGPGAAGDELKIAGSFSTSSPHALNLSTSGEIDASFLKLLLPETEIEGRLALDVQAAGTMEKPVVTGRIALDGVNFRPAGASAPFEAMTGTLHLTPGRVTTDDLALRFGGNVSVAGTLGLDGTRLDGIRIAAHLEHVRYQPFEGFKVTVSGDLVLLGDSNLRTARGELVVERGIYDEKVDLGLGALLGRLKPSTVVAPAPSSIDSVDLDVRLVAPNSSIEVRNNVARIHASGRLVARGTFGRPLLFGQIESEEGGRLTINDTRYELLSAKVLFSNPARIDPYFELQARTNIKEYQLTLGLSGTASRLLPRFTSDPPLSEAQIVSLMATGELPSTSTSRLPTGATPISTDESIAQATRELIAGLATSAVTSRTKELFRLDRLQIDPVFVGSTFDAPRLTVGKALSKDLLVTYSYKASSNQEQLILVEYQLTPKAFLQFVRDETGVYSVDLKIRQRLR